MKIVGFALGLICSSAFAGTLADVGIHVAIRPGVYQAHAGQAVEIPIAIKVDHPELATDGDVELDFWAYLADHEYAKNPSVAIKIVEDGKLSVLPDKLVIPTTAAMMGDYSLRGHMASLVEWGNVLTEDGHVALHIDNTLAQADLEAPVFKSIHIKKTYRLGESIVIQVEATDKSAICLSKTTAPACADLATDSSLAIICATTKHGDCLDDEIDNYVSSGGKIVDLGNNRYNILLDVAAPKKPGRYGLRVWDLMDVWGNQRNSLSDPILFDVVR